MYVWIAAKRANENTFGVQLPAVLTASRNDQTKQRAGERTSGRKKSITEMWRCRLFFFPFFIFLFVSMRRNVQTDSNKMLDRTFERSAIETTSLSRRAVETSLIKFCSLSSVSVLCSCLIQSNGTHSVVNIEKNFSSSFLLVFNCNENGIERSGDYIALKIYDSPFTVHIERTIAGASHLLRESTLAKVRCQPIIAATVGITRTGLNEFPHLLFNSIKECGDGRVEKKKWSVADWL